MSVKRQQKEQRRAARKRLHPHTNQGSTILVEEENVTDNYELEDASDHKKTFVEKAEEKYQKFLEGFHPKPSDIDS